MAPPNADSSYCLNVNTSACGLQPAGNSSCLHVNTMQPAGSSSCLNVNTSACALQPAGNSPSGTPTGVSAALKLSAQHRTLRDVLVPALRSAAPDGAQAVSDVVDLSLIHI